METAEGLTREAENIGSEAYAQKRETLEEEWQKCYGVLEEKYLQLMNRNICLHTGEGWEELKIMFSDAAFIQTFEKNDSFLEMKFLLEIYEAEVQAGVRHTVLDTEAQNIEELWEPIRNLRFFALAGKGGRYSRNGGRTLPQDSGREYIICCAAFCDSFRI